MKRSLLLLMLACTSFLLNACGGGGNTPPQQVATQLSVTASAAPVAGTAFNITVSALDASGAVVSSFSGTVHFTSSDAQAVLPVDSSLTGGTKSFSVTFKTAGSQTITVTASGLSPGNSPPITVSSGAATHFSVSAPASVHIGTAFNFTVTAQDSLKNTATGYSGTVHFTSSDSHALLPADGPLASGTATFSATLKTANTQTITATDTASITGTSSSIVVQTLSITSGPPPNGIVNAQYGTPHQVTVGDGITELSLFQLKATGGNGSYFWGWAAAPGSSLPPGLTCCSLQFVAQPPHVGGTLTDVISGKPTAVGTYNVVVSVADTETPPARGSANYTIVINPPPPGTHFSVTAPASATAGTPFNFTVTALDASNKTITGYSGTVQFTSSDAHAVLPANSALTNGTGSFPATLNTAGTQTITAADTVTASIAGISNSINTRAGSPQITSGTPPSGSVGVQYEGRHLPCKMGDPGCVCIVVNGQFICFYFVSGFDLTATGGATPYTWSWAAAQGSSLPPGMCVGLQGPCRFLNLNCVLNSICGRPTAPGTYNVVVTVTDSESPAVQASANYTIKISPPPSPVVSTEPPPPPGVLNQPYAFTFSASGYKTFTWIESGALPNGLAFSNSTAVLSGTPTVTGSFPISVTAADQFNQASAAANFTIVVSPHGFQATGSMTTARYLHTATLLRGGKVLVAGGQLDANNLLATAELFDPTAGTFAATGNMQFSRAAHTSTLLSSTGKVLIAGGQTDGAGTSTATAELYDPTASTFSSTGSMQTARSGQTATVLNTGKVLIVGGKGSTGNPLALASAELYDPATGIFTTTGNMGTARTAHTATLLANGKVLVTGGIDATSKNLASAELYDPVAGNFTAVPGTMTVTRSAHTANLLNSGSNTGKVLVAGGLDDTGKGRNTAELFDPISGSFSATTNMVSAHAYHTATLLNDGTVLEAGGVDASGNPTAVVEVFDTTSPGSFSATGSLVTAREQHTATLLANGHVLVTGGSNGGALASAEVYQ